MEACLEIFSRANFGKRWMIILKPSAFVEIYFLIKILKSKSTKDSLFCLLRFVFRSLFCCKSSKFNDFMEQNSYIFYSFFEFNCRKFNRLHNEIYIFNKTFGQLGYAHTHLYTQVFVYNRQQRLSWHVNCQASMSRPQTHYSILKLIYLSIW